MSLDPLARCLNLRIGVTGAYTFNWEAFDDLGQEVKGVLCSFCTWRPFSDRGQPLLAKEITNDYLNSLTGRLV